MNVAHLAEDSIRDRGERVSLVFEDREYTNVEIDEAARRLGNALRKLGVGRGDRVITQLPNCPEGIKAFQAVWKIGAVIVPISHLMGDEEAAHVYRDSGAQVVVTCSESLEVARRARSLAPEVKHLILTDAEFPDALSYQALTGEGEEELATAQTAGDELAILIYTAGTTGKPKGVMISHYALVSNASFGDDMRGIEIPPTLCPLPLCHGYGISIMNRCLGIGSKMILMRWFEAEECFRLIDKYRPLIVPAVPTMYVRMLAYPDADRYDLSSVLLWVSGSAPLSLETARAFNERFGATIHEGWGLTEAWADNTLNPVTGTVKTGSIGLPMRETEVKVCDDEDNEMAPGQEGEIVLRGPTLMMGYWNMPEESEQVLKGGWLRTGDIGYKDEDGYIFITERKKDIIIKGGENISPREIEEVLMTHPEVVECGVVGVKDEVYGEDAKAFVVLKPGARCAEEEIVEHCRARLGGFKTPRAVHFMESLPKNLMGKVLKRELRRLG